MGRTVVRVEERTDHHAVVEPCQQRRLTPAFTTSPLAERLLSRNRARRCTPSRPGPRRSTSWPRGVCAVPGTCSSHGARIVRTPMSGATGTHWFEALQTNVLARRVQTEGVPGLELARRRWARCCGRHTGTQSAPSHVPGSAEAVPATTIGAAVTPQASTSAAISFMFVPSAIDRLRRLAYRGVATA